MKEILVNYGVFKTNQLVEECLYNSIYNKALDDVIKMIKSHSEEDRLMNDYYLELVEEMKESQKEESKER